MSRCDRAPSAAATASAWRGPTGTGKTGLSSSIVLKALQNGYRCRFVKAQDLFDELYSSMAERSSRRVLNHLSRLDLLLLDEMGYLNLRPEFGRELAASQ